MRRRLGRCWGRCTYQVSVFFESSVLNASNNYVLGNVKSVGIVCLVKGRKANNVVMETTTRKVLGYLCVSLLCLWRVSYFFWER